jgi:hypothetical protein
LWQATRGLAKCNRAAVDTTVALTWLEATSRRQPSGVHKNAGLFLFTTEEKLALARPETILEKIWLRLGDKEPVVGRNCLADELFSN